MYFVKYGSDYLHDPRVDGYTLFDLSLDAEENTCGYCDFTIYPDHPMYDKLKERDADNPIEVYDDNVLLFAGYIYELGKEFYLDGVVKCRGELDYLSESIVRPYSTLTRGYGDKAPTTVNGYFEWLIEQHNNQVDSNKRFVVGINQGSNLDANNYLYRENDSYPNTFEELTDKLINNENVGGYLRIRHENNTRYIDYLSEWTDSNTQVLDFGVNLTDYTQTDDSEEVYTYVVPLGARMSETEYSYDDGYYVTSDTKPDPEKEYYTWNGYSFSQCSEDLTSFEKGITYYEYYEEYDESNQLLTISGLDKYEYESGYKMRDDIVYCESAVNKYGWIGTIYNNSEITVKENLVKKGILYLKEFISPKRTIEIKAVDMHLVNPDIKPIRVGEYVRVRSVPHNLDSYFLCTSITLNLNNPENSLYTLGTTFDTLTGQQNKRIKLLNSAINQTYEQATKLTEQQKKNATSANEALNNSTEAKSIAESAMTVASNTITEAVTEYATSLDPTTEPTEGWSTEAPEWSSEVFIWSRLVMTYGDGSIQTGPAVCMTGNSGQDGEDAVVLRIDSSRGTVFKNNSMSTVLSVVIYKGSELINNITDLHQAFGSSAYLEWYWQKVDEDEFGVILSTDEKISNNGFTLTISPEDVDTKVTFRCELIN